jgi:hypothetical protein
MGWAFAPLWITRKAVQLICNNPVQTVSMQDSSSINAIFWMVRK